jgi:hypothetical protein
LLANNNQIRTKTKLSERSNSTWLLFGTQSSSCKENGNREIAARKADSFAFALILS